MGPLIVVRNPRPLPAIRIFLRDIPQPKQVVTQVIVQFDESRKDRALGVNDLHAFKARRNSSAGCRDRDNRTFIDVEQAVFKDVTGAVHGDNLPAEDHLRSFCGIDDRLRFSLGNNFLLAH
jgi:hypothetical protein